MLKRDQAICEALHRTITELPEDTEDSFLTVYRDASFAPFTCLSVADILHDMTEIFDGFYGSLGRIGVMWAPVEKVSFFAQREIELTDIRIAVKGKTLLS